MDIKNFFDNIHFFMVRDIFIKIGYSFKIAGFLAILCCVIGKKKLYYWRWSVDYRKYGKIRHLPQGSPTSPALSNLIMYFKDLRLNQFAQNQGFRYSRYADDLTFSSTKYTEIKKSFKSVISKILSPEFTLNPHKTHIMKEYNRQIVTGVLINNGELSLPKKWIKQLRAALHQFEQNQTVRHDLYLASKWKKNIEGRINFAMMVNSKKYHHFGAKFTEIVKKFYPNL